MASFLSAKANREVNFLFLFYFFFYFLLLSPSLFVTIPSSFSSFVSALEVTKAEYVIEEGTVSGDFFQLGLFKVEFDEKLHLQSALYCPACAEPEESDFEDDEALLDVVCACDYTFSSSSPKKCGTLRPVNSKWENRCEELAKKLGDNACKFKKEMCSNEGYPGTVYPGPQPVLKAGVAHFEEQVANSVRNYTFFTTSYCSLYQVIANSTKGDPDLTVFLATSSEITKITISERYGPENFALCPVPSASALSDPSTSNAPPTFKGKMGTIIFQILAFQSTSASFGIGLNMTLVVVPKDIPSALSSSESKDCEEENDSKITCLTNDEYWNSDGLLPVGNYYFSFVLPSSSEGEEGSCSKFLVEATDAFSVYDVNPLENKDAIKLSESTEIGLNRILVNSCETPKKYYIVLSPSTVFSSGVQAQSLIASTRAAWETTPFSDLTQFSASWTLVGTTTVKCDDFLYACSDRRAACVYYEPLYGDRPNPFWPRYPATFGPTRYNSLFLADGLPLFTNSTGENAGKIYAGVGLLSAVVQTTFFSGASDRSLDSCEMTWGTGRITDEKGTPFTKPVKFQPGTASCERESFSKLSFEIRKTLDAETFLVGDNLTNTNFYLDQLGFTSEFQTCLGFVSTFLVQDKTEIFTNTSSCFPALLQDPSSEVESDPCCFTNLQWSTPCESREVNYTLPDFQEVNDKSLEQCQDPECTSTYVVDLGRAEEILNNPLEGCRAITFTNLVNDSTTWIPYKACREKAMGKNFTRGIPCRQDDDCYAGRCDLLNFRCIISIEEQEKEFIHCISKSVSPLVMFQVKDTLDIKASIGTEEFENELQSLISAPDCVGESDFALGYRNGKLLKFSLLTANCVDSCAPQLCPDEQCEVPIVCKQITKRKCYKKFFDIGGDKGTCLEDYYCNWSSESCEEGVSQCAKDCENPSGIADSFCGLCENGQDCIEFEDFSSESSCEKQEVCVLPDGTIDETLSKEECQKNFQCTDPCIRNGISSSCKSKNECDNNGYCEGAELFLEPKCVLPGPAYYVNSCDELPGFFSSPGYDSSIDSELGCVSLMTESRQECKDYAVEGSEWVKYESSTKKGCEKVGGYGCWELVSFPAWIGNHMFTNKTKEECKIAKGEWKPRFDFKPSRWISGTMRSLSWKKREYSTRRKWSKSTIDFPRLQKVIATAIQSIFSNQLRTEARCRFVSRLQAMNIIGCNCLEGGVDSDYICSSPPTIAGFARVCPGISTTLLAPPASISFGENSVTEKCIEVSITILSAQNYRSYRIENYASSFIEQEYVSNSYSFTNSEGVTIGQVIADGILIEVEGEVNTEEITVCIASREDIEIDNKFKILDFGAIKDNNRIKPLDREADTRETRKDAYCLRGTPINKELIPITRIDDWEDASRFSTTSKVLLSTLVGLFWFCTLFGAAILIYGLLLLRRNFLFVHWLVFVFMSFAFLRGLYFLLTVLNVIQSRFVDYFLTELPTFIYFSAFTVIIFGWSDVTARSDSFHKKGRKNLIGWIVVIFGNLFMYGCFTMFMILFGLYGSDTVKASCDGRVPPSNSELFNSQQYAIAIAYHVWITAVAFILSAILVYVGFRILRLLSGSGVASNKSASRQKRKRVVLSIMVICSLTFLAHTIWTLILVTTEFRNLILAFCLLVAIEVIPILFLIYILSPHHTPKVPTSTSAGGSSTTSNSKDRRGAGTTTGTTAASFDSHSA